MNFKKKRTLSSSEKVQNMSATMNKSPNVSPTEEPLSSHTILLSILDTHLTHSIPSLLEPAELGRG